MKLQSAHALRRVQAMNNDTSTITKDDILALIARIDEVQRQQREVQRILARARIVE